MRQRGIALLIVLWVMTILTVMAFSFSLLTRAEGYGTLTFKEGLEKKLLAEGGIERGITEIFYRAVNRNQALTLEGREPWRLDGTAYSVDMGTGGCAVRVIDESGKVALNGLTDSSGIVLRNLLIRQGVSSEDADIIVDSILDWKDADDLHHLNGAENDYYQSLPRPYKARNADFETLEELILVRGMTPEILYGTGKTKGIIHFLTAYGKTARINVNSAPRDILAALPGMDPEMADRLIEFRRSAEIQGEGDISGLLGPAYPQMAPYVNFGFGGLPGVFSVEATGYKDSPKRGYSILATVAIDAPRQYRYVYYKNPAEMMP
ncbi:MAG: general secretion pathway protein GspK [Deltaproteobacteria bacterium]|nr:general secretion pathway protein GspK [Deltaproteobacteria bacterium]